MIIQVIASSRARGMVLLFGSLRRSMFVPIGMEMYMSEFIISATDNLYRFPNRVIGGDLLH